MNGPGQDPKTRPEGDQLTSRHTEGTARALENEVVAPRPLPVRHFGSKECGHLRVRSVDLSGSPLLSRFLG